MGSASRRRLRMPTKFLLGGAIFTTAVVLFVVVRILTIVSVTFNRNCRELLTLQYGEITQYEGIFQTVNLTVIALLGLVVAATITGLARRDFVKLDILIGAVNLCLVTSLGVYCALVWAFNNPTAPYAKGFNGLSTTLGIHQSFVQVPQISVWEDFRSSNWEQVSDTEWRSESLGLIIRQQVIWTCFDEDFLRANLDARDPDYDGTIPWMNQVIGEAYYTLEGEYIISGRNTYDGFWPERRLRDEVQNTELVAYMSELLREDLKLQNAEYEAREAALQD